jgi:serine/threonine-protein kinase
VPGIEKRIGPYRLLKLLMTGQNSQVWEAMHDGQQQRYAVKYLLAERRHDREQIGYIKNEFAVGRGLDHPRVIHVHELGRHEGSPYLALEFYPHPNMKFYVQQDTGRIAPLMTQIIEQAAEGLAYFHAQGWVHRDIKPENYLLSPAGEVKLIDFALAQKRKTGLSKFFAGKAKVQGTRSYLSPEQIRGQVLDQRSDIYSFGCMLFELLAGKAPFTGSDTGQLLNKHLSSPPPLLTISNNKVTPDFALLVQRMLAKNPDRRPASMDSFLTEFKALRLFKEIPRPVRASAAEKRD